MYNFELTDYQKDIQMRARKFAQEEVLPGAIERDKTEVYDMSLLKKLGEAGLSGLRLTPDIYLAFGVAGANFHTIGMYRSGFILAVNIDSKARIFRLADFCVFAEAESVLDDLLEGLPENGLENVDEIREYVLSRVRKYPHKINDVRIND